VRADIRQMSEPRHDREIAQHVGALRRALARYEAGAAGASLDEAFALAAGAVARIRGERAQEPPDVEEVQALFEELPDFELLVVLAVAQAAQSAARGGAEVWRAMALGGEPPRWSDVECARARLLVACACAPHDARGAAWLRPKLLGLAAERWASLIVEQLSAVDEQWWRRALSERYESVFTRCAPRTTWRTRGLAGLPASDERTRALLKTRLGRWLAEGGAPERLAGELEAALVQGRTPARMA